MNFELSDAQKMLVDTAASFARKESPVTRMRKLRSDPIGYEPRVWRHMGELGWLGIPFAEDVGGYGGQFMDVALVLEQFGTTLVPEPYLPSVVLGGMAIFRAGNAEQQGRWLVPLIAGKETLALAYAERQSRHDVAAIQTRAVRAGQSYELSGEKIFVLNGHNADRIVVSALVAGERDDRAGEAREVVGLFVVDRKSAGLHVQTIQTMDGHKAAILRFERVTVGQEHRLERAGAELVEDIMDLGAAAACAEGLGIARTVLDMTVDYLKTREQFGLKIGAFQALQHRAVDMLAEVELCKSMAIYAGLKVDDPDPMERRSAVSAAKVQLGQGGRYVVRQGIQLHGGIGCTDEHDVGLYFKRMQVLGALFGDEAFHVERFAHLPSFTRGIEVPSQSA